MERVLTAVVLVIAFLVMASVFAPDRTRAGHHGDKTDATPSATSSDPHSHLMSLGTLESGRYRVDIYATADGPRYTVHDAADGSELGVLLTAEQVAEWFTDLQLPSTDFSASPTLMFTDPADMP